MQKSFLLSFFVSLSLCFVMYGLSQPRDQYHAPYDNKMYIYYITNEFTLPQPKPQAKHEKTLESVFNETYTKIKDLLENAN